MTQRRRASDPPDSNYHKNRRNGWSIEKTIKMDTLIVGIGLIVTIVSLFLRLEAKVNANSVALKTYIANHEKLSLTKEKQIEREIEYTQQQINEIKNHLNKN